MLKPKELFPTAPRVTKADLKRLRPHLAGSNKLSEILLLDPPMEDITKMIVIELTGARRRVILNRLVGRYHTKHRQMLLSHAKEAGEGN